MKSVLLFVHCKDTNLKAIHNLRRGEITRFLLFVHCKDTNLKAIHNQIGAFCNLVAVVRALQRY